jgi:hypothetical protein
VVQLIREYFGVALMAKAIAEEIVHPDIVAGPFATKDFWITSHLILRADQSSRLVNKFGRAFLKRSIPNAKETDASGQLLLSLLGVRS